MNGAFHNLTLGLIFAAVFVYLLMVVNFQSFLDPLVILLALPGAEAGILLMLLVTGTTLSVPSLMGAIMSIGVASANSILLKPPSRVRCVTAMILLSCSFRLPPRTDQQTLQRASRPCGRREKDAA